ncbi:MAG: hypothetical protein M1132_13065 [Chloroflexi bacterium]|nr:hypothetical protein [Chloroflexota bacterium]
MTPALTQEEIAKLEKELIAQGWTRQFTTFPNRLQEYIALYEEAGLEVRVEPWALTLDEDPSCSSCALTGLMRTIFTRKKESQDTSHLN